MRSSTTNEKRNGTLAGVVKPPTTDFYEDDEPLEKIKAVWERGEKGRTSPPGPRLSAVEFHSASALVVAGTFSGRIEGDRFADYRGVSLRGARIPS